MKKYIYFLVALGSFLTAHAKVLLWDLGGVLFEPDKLGVAQEIGITNFLSHAFWDMSSPTSIQKTLFDILDILEPPRSNNKGVAGSAHGIPLPTIMCRWQAGTITGREIVKKAIPLVKKLYKYDYFESQGHAELIIRCFRKMFDPKVLARNVYSVNEGFKLVYECCNRRNEDGTKMHRQFVFSNWDHISFDYFRKEHKHLFRNFEHIVISGHIKLIKPHADSFEYLLKTYNLNPKECILIDDQDSNARAARKCGMKAIIIRNGDYAAVRQDLVGLGVLK